MHNYKAYSKEYSSSLVEHLKNHNLLQWLQKDNKWKDNLSIIAAEASGKVIGHISLLKQNITLPNSEQVFCLIPGKPLTEMFVQTFFVDDDYRKQGIGTRLQEEALKLAKSYECYQMRSWSSYDKQANYQLKFNLGFAFAPATISTKKGQIVTGGYFVWKL